MGTAAKVLVGGPTSFKIAAYLPSKAVSLTYTDVGFTDGGVSFDPKTEHHLVTVDQHLGNLAAIPKARDLEIKVKFAEGTLTNLQYALMQATANLSGTSSLFINASDPELYYQLQVVGKGDGATGVRTMTVWRAFVKEMGALLFKKDAAQEHDLTWGVCEETTGSTSSGTFMRFFDA